MDLSSTPRLSFVYSWQFLLRYYYSFWNCGFSRLGFEVAFQIVKVWRLLSWRAGELIGRLVKANQTHLEQFTETLFEVTVLYEDFRPFKFQVSLGFFEILECRPVVFPILLGFRRNWRSFSQDLFKKLWWTKDCTQNCNNFKTQAYRSQFISDFLRCLNITVVCFVCLPETIK